MTPQEMVNVVRHAARAPEEPWQRVQGLRKAFHNDDTLTSRAVWEAIAANALDLADAPAWWDLLGADLAPQPWGRVRAALDMIPALHTRAAHEHQVARGLARDFWPTSSFLETLVRTRTAEVIAALPTLPADVQAGCAAHLVLLKTWPGGVLPASLVARAAEGYASVAHDEPLHPAVRALVGDDAWRDAVAAALSRDGVKPVRVARLHPALSRCDVAALFRTLDGLACGHDDRRREGAVTLLDAAFARDEAEATRRAAVMVHEVSTLAAQERNNALPWDEARRHRVRRLSSMLPVALALRAASRGEAPPETLDELMHEELGHNDRDDLELTRAAFTAFPFERRSTILGKHFYTERGLAVASLAMSPANVDALVAFVRQWSPKYGGPAAKVIELFGHGGEHAKRAVWAASAKEGPHRAVFLRALGHFADPAVSADLAQMAGGASKPERVAIAESLVAHGPVALSAVEGLLAAKKVDLRELGVEALKGIAAKPELAAQARALALRFADKEKSAPLRAALGALAETPADAAPADDFEAQLAALAAEIPEERRAPLRQAVRDTEGRVAQEPPTLGPAVLPYLLAWVRETGGDDRRYEGYHPFTSAVMRHMEHPLAPRIAVAGLYALGDKKVHGAKGFVSMLRLKNVTPEAWAKLPWQEVQARHKVLAAEVRQQLVAQMAVALPAQREHALDWLAEEAPVEAAPAFVRALGDTAKGIREQAVEVLCEKVPASDVLAAAVASQLHDSARATRLAAAAVLARWQHPAAADAVTQALAREKQPEVSALLQRALPTRVAPAPEAAASAPAPAAGEERVEDLDARLAAMKAPRAPKWLDTAALPSLRWRGGAALSPGAMKWFVGWLGQESESQHDDTLVSVRRRLVDEDCHALCDAIRGQWRAGGSAKAAMEFTLCQQAVLGSEARLWELGSVQQQWYDAKSFKANQLAALVLARHGGFSALAWLERWSATARGGQFTKAVTAAAELVSAQRAAPLETLVDLAAPEATDNPEVLPWLIARWELAMILGRRLSPEVWRAHFVTHPLLAAPARTLVFRAHPTGALLALDAQGEARDAAGAAVPLDGVTALEIAHPATLTEAEAKAWQMVPVSPPPSSPSAQDPIAQRGRPVVRVAAGAPDPFTARLGAGVAVQARRLVQRLRAARFEPSDLIDGGSYCMGVRRVSRHWRVEVHHDGIAAQMSAQEASAKVNVTGVSLRRGDDWVAPGDAPAGLVSEAMIWLEALLA